jgi:hypothetical protein
MVFTTDSYCLHGQHLLFFLTEKGGVSCEVRNGFLILFIITKKESKAIPATGRGSLQDCDM